MSERNYKDHAQAYCDKCQSVSVPGSVECGICYASIKPGETWGVELRRRAAEVDEEEADIIRAAERARIVAWLRTMVADEARGAFAWAADRIEAGAHLDDSKGGGR